jgi:hypothetical protein
MKAEEVENSDAITLEGVQMILNRNLELEEKNRRRLTPAKRKKSHGPSLRL